jgi:hypothetical protein
MSDNALTKVKFSESVIKNWLTESERIKQDISVKIAQNILGIKTVNGINAVQNAYVKDILKFNKFERLRYNWHINTILNGHSAILVYKSKLSHKVALRSVSVVNNSVIDGQVVACTIIDQPYILQSINPQIIRNEQYVLKNGIVYTRQGKYKISFDKENYVVEDLVKFQTAWVKTELTVMPVQDIPIMPDYSCIFDKYDTIFIRNGIIQDKIFYEFNLSGNMINFAGTNVDDKQVLDYMYNSLFYPAFIGAHSGEVLQAGNGVYNFADRQFPAVSNVSAVDTLSNTARTNLQEVYRELGVLIAQHKGNTQQNNIEVLLEISEPANKQLQYIRTFTPFWNDIIKAILQLGRKWTKKSEPEIEWDMNPQLEYFTSITPADLLNKEQNTGDKENGNTEQSTDADTSK